MYDGKLRYISEIENELHEMLRELIDHVADDLDSDDVAAKITCIRVYKSFAKDFIRFLKEKDGVDTGEEEKDGTDS